MTLSKNAIGNLIAKYSAVLKKCALINFVAAGLLIAGGNIALADPETEWEKLTKFLQSADESSTDYTLATDINDIGNIGSTTSIATNPDKTVNLNGFDIIYSGNQASASAITIPTGGSLTINSAQEGAVISGFNSTVDGVFIHNNGTLYLNGTVSKVDNEVSSTLKISQNTNSSTSSSYHGIIQNTGTMYIDGALFESNYSTGSASYAGVIAITNGYTKIINSYFLSNTAVKRAAAIGSGYNSQVDIDNCVFDNNHSDSMGGAIYFGGGNYKISNTDFINNTGGEGGVFYINESTVLFDSSNDNSNNFESNKSGQNGGVIAFEGASKAEVGTYTVSFKGKNNFKNNISTSNGGAIHVFNVGGELLSFESGSETIFESNTSSNGGAISLLGSAIFEGNAEFSKNTASSNGGAIYIGTTGNLYIKGNLTFTKNTANELSNDIYNTGNIFIGDKNSNQKKITTLLYSGYTGSENSNLEIYEGSTLYLKNGSINTLENNGKISIDGGFLNVDSNINTECTGTIKIMAS